MTEVVHGVLVAVGVQADSNTVNQVIRDLTDPVDETNGVILGYAEAGDDATGITLPDFTKVFTEVPDVPASFTKYPSAFTRVSPEGMTISFTVKGNGAPGTQSADEALPLAGIDAIYRAAGLTEAALVDNDSEYSYEPSSLTEYVSIRLWSAGQTWLLKSCVVESLSLQLIGGEKTVATASIRVGSLANDTDDGAGSDPEIRAIPTVTYGTQATLTPPISQKVGFQWDGVGRCYGELTVEIANTIENLSDSCSDNGLRLSQSARQFNVTGTIWQEADTGLTDYEWRSLVDDATATPAKMDGQIGTAAGAASIPELNAYYFSLNGIDIRSLNYVKAGAYSQAQITGVCTSTTANGEFLLTFN